MAKLNIRNLATGAFSWIKQTPSAAWWLVSKSPKLLRRGIRVALIYLASLAAEKVLDEAHEQLPDNEFVAKADTVVRAVVTAENFLIGGVTSIAKTAYDAVPIAKPAPLPKPEPAPAPTQAIPLPEPQKTENDTPKDAPLPLVGELQPREAAFLPVEPVRNRANLNTVIAAPEQHADQALAPDGLPVAGGYEAATGITWGAYMKPANPRPNDRSQFNPKA